MRCALAPLDTQAPRRISQREPRGGRWLQSSVFRWGGHTSINGQYSWKLQWR
jgi:hypothetical protein